MISKGSCKIFFMMDHSVLHFCLILVIGLRVDVTYAQECSAVEVVFLLDKSGTTNDQEWNLMKTFANSLATELQVNENSNLGGVVAFAEQKDFQSIYCDQTNTLPVFKDEVSALVREQGELLTDIINTLRKGYDILSRRGCGRDDVQQIMIIISDGKANRPITSSFQELYDEAASIRNRGVLIYAVSLIPSSNHLNIITNGNTFGVNGVAQLSVELARRVSSTVCAVTTTTTPTTTTTSTTSTTTPPPSTITTTTTTTPSPTTTTTTPTTTTPPPTTTTSTTTTTTTTSTTTPETTTTSTTTTTDPTTTTSTTTESTTTTPPPSTTTTTTTITTTAEPEPNITVTCSCDWNLARFFCLKWTRYEIIRNFTGTCFKDKLEKAIAELTLQINQLSVYINITVTCRSGLQEASKLGEIGANTVFDLYDQCTIMGECKLAQLRHMLQQRLTDLQDMLTFEDKFDLLDIYGFKKLWNHMSRNLEW